MRSRVTQRCALTACFCLVAAIAQAGHPSRPLALASAPGRGGAYGPSIAVDPTFAYYQQRSAAEICRKIHSYGFSCVHLLDHGAEGTSAGKSFPDAARAEGLVPVLCVFPGTHQGLYRAHPEWRQRMLTGIDGRCDWRTYLCPNQPAFVSAYCGYVERRMREGGFAGVQLTEIWLENWGGPKRDGKPNPNYACVCDACLARFKTLTGVDGLQMLSVPSSPRYFEKPANAALYARWCDLRVQIIQDFGRAIIAAARKANPKACIKITYLADARVKLDGAREYLGTDLERMLKEWKPDVLTFQDAWQDWLQKDLSPAFVADYARAYKQRVEKLRPGIFIMSHADIGSRPESRRSLDWIRQFSAETVRAGFGAPSFYEWHISTLAE